MGLTTADERLKVQLFRFVDTLPYLIDDPAEIARHLREYLREGDRSLPWWLRTGLHLLPSTGVGGRLLAAAARFNAERMARKFIAGSTVDEALDAVARMRAGGLAFTIDLLGEATVSETEADLVGLEMGARAGFDPKAAITLWQKMERVSGSSGSAFLSDHPSGTNRLRILRDNIPRVEGLYREAIARR